MFASSPKLTEWNPTYQRMAFGDDFGKIDGGRGLSFWSLGHENGALMVGLVSFQEES